MNENMNGQGESPDLQAARMARVEKARLRTMFSDPIKGPSARFAHDSWQPFFKFMIEEKAKGTNPELLQVALGAFFAQAMFQLGLNMNDPIAACRLGMNAAARKLDQCFAAKQRNSLIIPAKPPLVVAQRDIDPKKIK